MRLDVHSISENASYIYDWEKLKFLESKNARISIGASKRVLWVDYHPRDWRAVSHQGWNAPFFETSIRRPSRTERFINFRWWPCISANVERATSVMPYTWYYSQDDIYYSKLLKFVIVGSEVCNAARNSRLCINLCFNRRCILFSSTWISSWKLRLIKIYGCVKYS